MDRSPAMIVAMLAVIKAGAAYLPLDPRYPAARIRQTLDDDATPALAQCWSNSAAHIPARRLDDLATA